MLLLLALTAFAIVLGLTFGTYWVLILRPEREDTRHLHRRLSSERAAVVLNPDLMRSERPLSGMQSFARLLAKSGSMATALHERIERAGLTLTVGSLVLTAVFLGIFMFAICAVVTRMPLVSAGVGTVTAALPFLFVRYKAAKRLRKFEQQFPEAIDLISRALRAGHALTTGLSMVPDEVPAPVGSEFRRLYDRQNFGLPLPECLRDMAMRVPLVDVRFFVAAVLTQRESGGNLAEVLDNLSAITRERFVLKRHVRVVSAHGRITGWVLGGLPIALGAVLTLIAPAHMSVMITDPMGRRMVMAVLALQVVGMFIIRRIVDIEV